MSGRVREVPQINSPGRHNLLAFPTNYAAAMTFDEIAEALGTSRQHVWSLYVHGLEKIRRELRRNPRRYAALLQHTELDRAGAQWPDWTGIE